VWWLLPLPALLVVPSAPASQVPIQGVGGAGHVTRLSSHDVSRYEALYGEPIYWSLSLLVSPIEREEPPRSTAILTRGLLSAFSRPGANPDVSLCQEMGRYGFALTRPAPEIAAEFFADAPFRHGHEAHVVGAFTDEGFLFWSVDSAERRDRVPRAGAERVLADLVARPDRFHGRTVTVRGRFRGANLFGDFPSDPPVRNAWVLRDGPFFVWITGREARGPGWRLDTSAPGDCVWNVEVEGKVERHGDAVSVKARVVRLLGRDPDTTCATHASR